MGWVSFISMTYEWKWAHFLWQKCFGPMLSGIIVAVCLGLPVLAIVTQAMRQLDALQFTYAALTQNRTFSQCLEQYITPLNVKTWFRSEIKYFNIALIHTIFNNVSLILSLSHYNVKTFVKWLLNWYGIGLECMLFFTVCMIAILDMALQWCHMSITAHRITGHDSLFGITSKKHQRSTSLALGEGNPLMTSEFPSQNRFPFIMSSWVTVLFHLETVVLTYYSAVLAASGWNCKLCFPVVTYGKLFISPVWCISMGCQVNIYLAFINIGNSNFQYW